ncbi:hypothetical protein CONLIGDRAFT_682482 [Coniochaeta ligniaria NRRL 30616]|uniref:Histone chaperone domain-containing protein n=1 Tax=Coniochaeta ligniaria NRRL 30616 TaxID=1408157 RepID=A0A1J7JDX6_9PEZI|nr:hypothetical protein CONLIGDRAFT_682482 [Coniochaeta ligniaria NRRL 30616]
MASTGSGATTTGAADNQFATESKGKGKAAASEIPQDTPMGDDAEDDDDDEEDEVEEEGEPEVEDEDNMEEIDLDNVIGKRTRGKVIDFAKAAEENPAEEEDDEDDDEDFEAEDSRMDED